MIRVCVFAICVLALVPGSRGQEPVPPPRAEPPAASDAAPGVEGNLGESSVPYLKNALPGSAYLDLDEIPVDGTGDLEYLPMDEWAWRILPTSLIYPPYLAGVKESRFAAVFNNINDDGWLFDAELGTRVALLRYGTLDSHLPDGFEIEAEGSAQARLDMPENIDVRSTDYRAGLPIVYGVGASRWKFGYYHISSHLGDEFLISHPGYPRLNYVRDVLVLGHTRYLSPRLRAYFEVGWAFHVDVSQPWEFQFGLDYVPFGPTGIRGAPFVALNAHLRDDVDYSGSLNCQAGWAWRSGVSTSLLRVGLQYFNGLSNQYSFYRQHEEQLGIGVWYDF